MKPESVFDPRTKPPHVLCAAAIGTAMDVLDTAMYDLEDCADDLDQQDVEESIGTVKIFLLKIAAGVAINGIMAAQLGCEHFDPTCGGPLLALCDIVMDG